MNDLAAIILIGLAAEVVAHADVNGDGVVANEELRLVRQRMGR